MENSQPILCYGDEENARIYAVHLTTANQSVIRSVYLVSVVTIVEQIIFLLWYIVKYQEKRSL